MTLDAFSYVYDDPRIESITIVDDASDQHYFEELKQRCSQFEKINLIRNDFNRDCYFNKYTALINSSSKWNILLDSDNRIGADYVNKLYDIEQWDDETIYTPSFAAPHFDFKKYSGLLITKENVAEWIDKPLFETMLNAANFFVNKDKYCEVFDPNVNPVTSDSIYISYLWLKSGYKIKVVEGLEYFHKVHDGSHYKNNVHRTPNGFHESILQKLREFK